MKTRKSTSYLIISSSHLGISEDILKVFGNVATKFGALTYHIGELEHQTEIKDLNKIERKITSIQSKIERFGENTNPDTEDKATEDLSDAVADRGKIIDSVISRVASLKQAFKNKITFLIPSDCKLAEELSGYDIELEYDEVVISKYLMLSSMQPVSDVSTIRPANRNAIQALKQYGNKYSWIVPHPVPAVLSYPRPGLNNAHNYYTTGSLRHVERPKSRKTAYMASHAPSAILVVVDSENGEFHAVPLHVDYVEKNGYSKSHPMVLYDGLCFTTSGVSEVSSSGRAVFMTDEHEPYNHPGVLGAVRTLTEIFQPETFINGGDSSDFTAFSHHEMDKPGNMEGIRVSDMLKGMKAILDAQTECPSIKTRVLIDSNHAEWISQFIAQFPQFKGFLDWETISRDYLPLWDVIIRNKFDRPYKFGDYSIRHGDTDKISGSESMFDHGKFMCGHFHRNESVRRQVMVGCGCLLNPPYLKGKITSWQTQVTSLTCVNGITAVAPKIVLHSDDGASSRFLFRNRIIQTKQCILEY